MKCRRKKVSLNYTISIGSHIISSRCWCCQHNKAKNIPEENSSSEQYSKAEKKLYTRSRLKVYLEKSSFVCCRVFSHLFVHTDEFGLWKRKSYSLQQNERYEGAQYSKIERDITLERYQTPSILAHRRREKAQPLNNNKQPKAKHQVKVKFSTLLKRTAKQN